MYLPMPRSTSPKIIIIYKSRQPEKQEDTHLLFGQCPNSSQAQGCPHKLTGRSPPHALRTTCCRGLSHSQESVTALRLLKKKRAPQLRARMLCWLTKAAQHRGCRSNA